MIQVSDPEALEWIETPQGTRWLNDAHKCIGWTGPNVWMTIKDDVRTYEEWGGSLPSRTRWYYQQPGSFCTSRPPWMFGARIYARALPVNTPHP